MRIPVALALAVAGAMTATAGIAQPTAPSPAHAFPAKPVRVIVAFPPGGGVDIVARTVGPKLTDIWRQQVIVDNRAGASGIIGTEFAARAAPDGHTIFIGTMGNLTVNHHLFPKMPVDPLRDFAPITLVVAVHFVMVAHPSLPARNVKELIALARYHPGKINYSSSGAGGAPHLGGELFKIMARVNLVHVPYKGSGPSFQDLLGGHVSMTFDSLVQSLPYIKSGKLKALAVLGKTRSPLLPEVPTVAETVSGYDLTNWFGLVVPVATPREIIAKLNEDWAKVLGNLEVRTKLSSMGADVAGNKPEAFGAFMKAESIKWAKVIKEAHIRAE